MKTIFFWVIFAMVFGGVVFGTSLSVYWLNERPPISFASRQVMTQEVPPGGELVLHQAAELTKGCEAVIYPSIVDAGGVLTNFEARPRPATPTYDIKLIVPLGAAPGKASYLGKVEWICNVVQTWFPYVVYQRESPFEISPVKGQEQMPEQQGIYSVPELP